MGRYDGEEYEYVQPCGSGYHAPAPNGSCHRCRHQLDSKERARSAEAERIRIHERFGCPGWCDGTSKHHLAASIPQEDDRDG